MSYLVMECHCAYAVVLDNEGRFLKVANFNYKIGDTVFDVVELSQPQNKNKSHKKLYSSIISVAASVCLIAIISWQLMFTAYATVRIRINPNLKLTVNRLNYVINVEALNKDAEILTEDYSFKFKKYDEVSLNLTQKAEEMGYLKEGGNVRIYVESKSTKWQENAENEILTILEENVDNSVTVKKVEISEVEEPHTDFFDNDASTELKDNHLNDINDNKDNDKNDYDNDDNDNDDDDNEDDDNEDDDDNDDDDCDDDDNDDDDCDDDDNDDDDNDDDDKKDSIILPNKGNYSEVLDNIPAGTQNNDATTTPPSNDEIEENNDNEDDDGDSDDDDDN